jgi:hypothetical protein
MEGAKEVPQQAHSRVPYGARYPLLNRDLLNDIVRLAPGCKRIIVDPGYLESLHRPNVTLSYDGIKDIVPQGVRLESGEIVQLDVLILGTGFSLVRHSWPHRRFPVMLTFSSCHLAWRSLAPEVFGFLTIGIQRMDPKPIMESRCRTFPTFSCFLVCPQYWSAVPMRQI